MTLSCISFFPLVRCHLGGGGKVSKTGEFFPKNIYLQSKAMITQSQRGKSHKSYLLEIDLKEWAVTYCSFQALPGKVGKHLWSPLVYQRWFLIHQTHTEAAVLPQHAIWVSLKHHSRLTLPRGDGKCMFFFCFFFALDKPYISSTKS